MPRIYCADVSCEYNGDKGKCKFPNNVLLSWHSVQTVHDGRQEFMKCKAYKESEISKKIREGLGKITNE